MRLIEFLRKHDWETAKEILQSDEYGVDVREHDDGRTLFKYNQYTSNFDKPLVRECRGVILDRFNDWRVVSRPFDKFFYHSQKEAAKIDWTTARAFGKLDGTLCTMYWWKDQWRIQTNKMIEADHKITDLSFGKHDITFEQLFWKIFCESGYDSEMMNIGHCYMFELCSNYNTVITKYEAPCLVLIGVRHLSGKMPEILDPEAALPFRMPRSVPVRSLEEALELAEQRTPEDEDWEGVVVCDANFNRIKVKNSGWSIRFYDRYQKSGAIAASKANLIECVLAGDHPEFLDLYPEFKIQVEEFIVAIEKFSRYIEDEFAKVKDIEGQWNFANAVMDHPYKHLLFAKRSGKVISVKRHLLEIGGKKALQLLKKFIKEK